MVHYLRRHFDEFIIRVVDLTWESISFLEVVANPRWKSVMLEEMESISHNQTWQLVELSPRKKSIKFANWIYIRSKMILVENPQSKKQD
jgi:hypothetical protein